MLTYIDIDIDISATQYIDINTEIGAVTQRARNKAADWFLMTVSYMEKLINVAISLSDLLL